MRILLDTNIILDVILERSQFVEDSTKVMALVETENVEGYLCATTFTTIYYLVQKSLGLKKADHASRILLDIFKTTFVNHEVLVNARNSKFKDYEDAVLHESALLSNIDFIITRNTKDFKNASIEVMTPKEFLTLNSI